MRISSQLSDNVRDRLRNWKFSQALRRLDDPLDDSVVTEDDRDTMEALDKIFGNCGWIDGEIGVIIRAAVWSLEVYE